MTNSLSLGPVLDLIERWQQARRDTHWPIHEYSGPDEIAAVHERLVDAGDALAEVAIPALKALAEQHAAQLREMAATPFDEECNTLAAHRCADWLVGEEK